MRFPKITRDLVLFVGGMVGILNEAFIHTGPERPYLLVVFAAMAGLPVFLYQDEHRGPKPPKPPSDLISKDDLISILKGLKK